MKIGLQALLKLRTDLFVSAILSLKYHDARRSVIPVSAWHTIRNRFRQSQQGVHQHFWVRHHVDRNFRDHAALDWQLTLVSLGIVPLVVGAIYLFAHRIRRESTSIQEHESAVLAQAQEGLSSIRMVHAFGREEFEVRQFHQQARQSLQANLRLTLTNVNSALVISTLMVVGTAVMYYIGTLHVLAEYSHWARFWFSVRIC